MLMAIRNNDIFPEQTNAQSFNNSHTTKSGKVGGAYLQETPRSNSQYISPVKGTQGRQRSRANSAAKRRSPPLMNGLLSNTPQPVMYVRALYDYEADDRTSLSFHEGDVIQVITQLETGWWDGVINGVRGWFPSNYCHVIPGPEEMDIRQNGVPLDIAEEEGEEADEEGDDYEDQYEDDDLDSGRDNITALPMEGTNDGRTRADFWIPQATPDGRLFYFNTETGESSMELPLESPSSATENGPRNRMNVNIPEKTRPPPQMMAGGYMQDDDDESEGNSASEMDGESIMMASRGSYIQRKRRSLLSEGVSPATSMDSLNKSLSPISRPRVDPFSNPNMSMGSTIPTMGTSTTSFANPSSLGLVTGTNLPRSFLDDGVAVQLTWTRLVGNMKKAIDRYREAINNNKRSEYVRRAEDISDHLRLLLAAGSKTTDNHSGQPSIISANKELYPHFRDMMSKFSKLVISSHIAAADWPNAESYQKCLQEAEGVLAGVYSYVEVARAQRGEEIPRLLPGFVIGSNVGGNWHNNGIGGKDPVTANFIEEDEALVEPTATLDAALMERLDDLKRMLISSIRKLEEHLVVTEKIISPYRHELIGNNVCTGARKVLEMFKPWVAVVESVNLSLLGNAFQNPQLVDFAGYKQSLYDNISDLVLACQAVAGPLSDEWSEMRGESLEARLENVGRCVKALETTSSHIGFSLQLLEEQVQTLIQQRDGQKLPTHEDSRPQRDPRRAESQPYERLHTRSDSRINPMLRPALAVVGTTQSYNDSDAAANYRKGENSKVRKFFGEEPRPAQDETPDCLKLDHETDIVYDNKVTPPVVKGGSLVALVEQLTRHDKLDSSFNGTFLLTYRSFTTAREMFEMLVKRFQIQPPEGMAASDSEIWKDRKQKPIRFRVVNILKSWFDNFWMEDQSEATKRLIRDVHEFARDTVKTTETPGSGPLMAILDQRLRGQLDTTAKRLVLTVNSNTPTPIIPKNRKKLKFLDIDSTEFARQLTIVESKLYCKIKPTECLNKTWQKNVGENEPAPAPMVKALILHSNQLTNWVAEMILTQMDVKKRVVVIKHFVLVAEKCRLLNNYSTLTSIISALGTAPIHRLKRTWDQVPQKILSTLEGMRRLMGSTKNFGEYRESLHLASPPCIPFFGVYLTDLTFIEDGIPSLIKKSSLINFAKRAKTAEVIRDIQQYQNVPYPLQPVFELQDYILSNMQAAGDVHEMYEKSLAVEPREREDEKIVRYVRLDTL
ncbi:cell division control protein-like protein Cdc25 [Calycina marina]|uniref:Class E vacuolar protein-sorting machinery protein HSE1 n=1 Tax=Calycina marina TaxID=1763456 RepID=A0A9P7YVX6_9HELO|nr:cell division control protein-like protein Cdc25 [Calycina marina]